MQILIPFAALLALPAIQAIVLPDGTVCTLLLVAQETLISVGKIAGTRLELVERLLLRHRRGKDFDSSACNH